MFPQAYAPGQAPTVQIASLGNSPAGNQRIGKQKSQLMLLFCQVTMGVPEVDHYETMNDGVNT